MSDLHSADRSLLEAARGGSDPTEADHARVHKRLVGQLGPAALGLSAAATSASTALGAGAAGVGSGWTATKMIVAIALAAGAGGGGMLAFEAATAHRGPVVQATEPAPRAIATTSAPVSVPRAMATAAPSATPAASAAPVEAKAPAASAPPAPTSSKGAFDDEMKLLALADAALRSNDGVRAMALLDEHAQRYPRSALDQERSVERVLALCAQGRLEDARDAAARFVSSYPSSPYVARVRASCAGRAE